MHVLLLLLLCKNLNATYRILCRCKLVFTVLLNGTEHQCMKVHQFHEKYT